MKATKKEVQPEQKETLVEQPKIRKVLRLGFSALFVLTVLIGYLGLHQLNRFKERIVNIVEVSSEKIAHTIAMRDAILMRALSAHKLYANNDVLQRTEELQKFNQHSRAYREARDALLAHKMARDEQKLKQTLLRLLELSSPLDNQTLTLLLTDPLSENAQRIIESAVNHQQQLLELLNQFVRLQKQYEKQLVIEAKHEFQSTILMIVGSVVVLLLVGAVVGRQITHLVSSKNLELFAKNKELEAAWFQAAKATHEKSKFLASMSHEIRTPLTSIIGFAQTLLEPNQQQQDLYHAAESIKHSGDHLHQIINDVLDVSKIEAGRMELEYVAVPVYDIVGDVCEMIEEKIKKKNLLLSNTYCFPIPKTIVADPTRLRQVLLNLLGNAVKFTSEGQISIRTSYLAEQRVFKFDVSDTGIGMSYASLAKVFEPFSQAETSTTRHYGGTGLGLSISKQLAEKMGGDIQCDSKSGQGSTFTLTIPLGASGEPELIDDATALQKLAGTESKVSNEHPFYEGHVLLAEDTYENQELIAMLLRKSGVDVDIVENGRQAIDAAMAKSYDLILMDMQMPLLGGLDAIKELRECHYAQPIVALTANALKQDREACEQAGADGFLVKPIDFPKFYQVLSQYLRVANAKHSDKQIDEQADKHKHPGGELSSSNRVTLPQVPLNQTLAEISALSNGADYDEELLAIVNSFMTKLPSMVESIQQSAHQKDWQELESLSHKLKGLGGSFGYDNLTKISADINSCAHQRLEDQLTQYINDLKREYDIIIEKYDAGREAS